MPGLEKKVLGEASKKRKKKAEVAGAGCEGDVKELAVVGRGSRGRCGGRVRSAGGGGVAPFRVARGCSSEMMGLTVKGSRGRGNN